VRRQDDAIERITSHRQRADQLRRWREELIDLMTTAPSGPTPDQLATLIASINDADVNTIRRLFETVIRDVCVTERDNIRPYFRIPTNGGTPDPRPGVRTLSGSVPPARFELATHGLGMDFGSGGVWGADLWRDGEPSYRRSRSVRA